MSTLIKTTIAAIALSALFVGTATAAVSKRQLSQNVYSAIGSNSNIFVTEQNGVVTMNGYYSDSGDQAAAIRAAEGTDGVVRVINNAFSAR